MANSNDHGLFSIPTGISLLRFYWRAVVRPHMGYVLMLGSFMLLGATLDMITVGLSVPLFDAVTKPNEISNSKVTVAITAMLRMLAIPQNTNTIVYSLLVIASFLFIVRSALGLVQQYSTTAIGHKLRRNMKFALFESSLQAQYEEQSRKGRGAILQDINGPSGALYGAIVNLGGLFSSIFNSVLLLGLMVYLSWWAALTVGVLALGGVHALRRVLDQRAYVRGRTVYELQRELSKVEVDSIDGLKIVKTHGLESSMIQRQQSLLAAEVKPMLQVALLRQIPGSVNEVVASFIVLGLGGITFLWPSVGMSFSTLVAFLLAIRRVSPALAGINAASVELNRTRRDLEVIEDVLHLTPPERQGERLVERIEELRLSDLSFYYESRPEEEVLKGINLVMKRGTVTALVGATGAGKSTIANLLVGLYTPRSGAIFVNNVDLCQLSLTAWRQKIGYVCQDTFLFNATLRENIVLWEDDVRQEDLERAAQMAQLHEFVQMLPEGYDTVVGDRGLRLSGGQCQRVAIARAILRRPDVLILDEATSALDNLTEKAVYEAIHALRKDAIVIVIAHRLSTVKDADQIAVLSSGKVVELGTHESLVDTRGIYAELYQQDVPDAGEETTELESRRVTA